MVNLANGCVGHHVRMLGHDPERNLNVVVGRSLSAGTRPTLSAGGLFRVLLELSKLGDPAVGVRQDGRVLFLGAGVQAGESRLDDADQGPGEDLGQSELDQRGVPFAGLAVPASDGRPQEPANPRSYAQAAVT